VPPVSQKLVPAKPPDLNPKKPKLQAPPDACDTHFHLFGPAAKYPFDPGSPYVSDDRLPEHVFALHDKLGIGRGVVVSGGGYGRSTRHLIDTMTVHNGRLRGVALLPDLVSRAGFEQLNRLGVRGLRFISATRGAHLPHISERLAAQAFEFGWHVQFYPNGTDIIDHADRLLALPNDIVLDHFASVPAEGGVDQKAFRTVLKMLESGRVWVKLSGPMRCTRQEYPYPAVTPLARALVRAAPERLVWGSDWPHVNMNDREMPNDGDVLDLMLEWVPDGKIRNRILSGNPARLYGF
jgi:predicted TIM-barrel fold metal-dependent hydrolase